MPEGVEREFTGPEKAAAVMLMLGATTAGRVLRHFEPHDLRTVARAAAGLGAVPPITLDRLAEEFAASFSAGVNVVGDEGQARNLLAAALSPGEVDNLLSPPTAEEFDVWLALAT